MKKIVKYVSIILCALLIVFIGIKVWGKYNNENINYDFNNNYIKHTKTGEVIFGPSYTGQLFVISNNGQETKKLNINKGGSIENFAIQDGWIYYYNGDDRNIIYKITLIEEDNTKLSESNNVGFWGYKIQVMGDWVYSGGVGNRLWKVKTDGTDKTLLSEDICDDLIAYDGWIYYSALDVKAQESILYKINAKNRTKILLYSGISGIGDGIGDKLCYSDGWIFFNMGDNSGIYKIDKNGENLTQLIHTYSRAFNIHKDWVYYYNEEEQGIYKIGTDGLNNIRLTNDNNVEFIEIVEGNRLLYQSDTYNSYYSLGLINMDGNEKKAFESFEDLFLIEED